MAAPVLGTVVMLLSTTCLGQGEQQAREALREAAVDVQRAVLTHDTDVIARYVNSGGIPCIDDAIPREQVLADLQNRKSWLYAYLFLPADFDARFKSVLHPISMHQYLRTAKDLDLDVSIMETSSGRRLDAGCVQFRSSNFDIPVSVCFYQQNGKWWLMHSPYDCN